MTVPGDRFHVTVGLPKDVRTAGVYAARGQGREVVRAFARHAEDAGVLAVFVADVPHLALGRDPGRLGTIEPLALVTALAQSTERLGYIATVSTSFHHPYSVARQLATIDHLTNGRIAWNAVTSVSGERNYGATSPAPPSERYRRAAEFIEVTSRLLTSWAPSAIREREGNLLADPDRIATIDHEGDFFRVEGPLDVPPGPQRIPPLFQAGASELGIDLGRRYADAVYTTQPDPLSAIEIAAALTTDAADPQRRSPIVLAGLSLILGESDAHARDKERAWVEGIDLANARRFLAFVFDEPRFLELDDTERIDVLIPDRKPDEINHSGRYDLVAGYVRRHQLTLRRAAPFLTAGGHWRLAGGPESVADALEERFRTGTFGAVNINLVDDEDYGTLFDRVLPLLRRRALVPDRYDGSTLAADLGLGDRTVHRPRPTLSRMDRP